MKFFGWEANDMNLHYTTILRITNVIAEYKHIRQGVPRCVRGEGRVAGHRLPLSVAAVVWPGPLDQCLDPSIFIIYCLLIQLFRS